MSEVESEEAMFKAFMAEMEKAQENWAKAQTEIEKCRFEGKNAAGTIRVVLTGKFKVDAIEISPQIAQKLASDSVTLAREVANAFNAAVGKAELYFQDQINTAMQQFDDEEEEGEMTAPQITPRLPEARPGMKG